MKFFCSPSESRKGSIYPEAGNNLQFQEDEIAEHILCNANEAIAGIRNQHFEKAYLRPFVNNKILLSVTLQIAAFPSQFCCFH